MPDQEPIMELQIFQSGNHHSTLHTTGSKNVSVKSVCMPLAILVDKMLDAMEANPEAKMSDLGIQFKEEEVDNG